MKLIFFKTVHRRPTLVHVNIGFYSGWRSFTDILTCRKNKRISGVFSFACFLQLVLVVVEYSIDFIQSKSEGTQVVGQACGQVGAETEPLALLGEAGNVAHIGSEPLVGN